MAEGATSVDALLADAVTKLDALSKRMDAMEMGEGSRQPVKGDAAKKADDDDDKKKDDGISAPKSRIIDDDDDDKKKDDSKKRSDDDDDDRRKDSKKRSDKEEEEGETKEDAKKRSDDDDDDDKRKDSKKRSDDGELEIKHKGEGETKGDKKRSDAKKRSDDDDDDRRKDSKKRSDDDDDDKRKDSRADSVSPELLARLGRLEKIIRPLSDEEHEQFAETQARADSVYNGFGKRAPRPLEGEDLIDYRTRLANDLKLYSKIWSKAKLSRLPVETFAIAESQIYADAIEAAAHPVDLGEGELRAVTSIDNNTGLRTTKFYGKESFVKSLGRPGRRLLRIRTDRAS